MPRAQQKGGVRGHGQRGERGSYRNAWAEGNYTRQGLDGTSDEDEAASADVRASIAPVAALLVLTGRTMREMRCFCLKLSCFYSCVITAQLHVGRKSLAAVSYAAC